MSFSRSSLVLWGCLWLALAPLALAQRAPRIGYVYPAGGRQGTTFEVTLGGQSLDGVAGAIFSGAGIKAAVLRHERQLTPREQKEMTEKLSRIREKREQGTRLTAEEERQAAEIRQTLTKFGRRLPNPGLNEFITLLVTIASNAEPGRREIRLETPIGLTNPLPFHVGQLLESSKKDWKNIPKSRESMDPELSPSPNEMRVTLPLAINGQTQPGGVDRFRFKATRGQQLVAAVSARELVPFIADAVPGWFQATLTLYDAQGKELDCLTGYRPHPDPALFYRIPNDGEYVLEIRDSIYRGREDFVYRITVGELPFVTGVFPLGGPVGRIIPVTLAGWNLAQPALTVDLRNRASGVHPFLVRNKGLPSNLVPFAGDTLPEISEQEPNNSLTNAQPVALPVIINGRIGQSGDADVFRFEGRAGERIVAEVLARRLDSPLDSTLRLTDATSKQLAFNDDHEDKGSGLNTHHADSYLIVTLPTSGIYFVHLRDAQRRGSAAHAYRLRLGAPRPDFELRVAPASLNCRGGTCSPLAVYALRKDGFTGPITLALKDAPEGFALAGAEVPAGQDRIKITLAAPSIAGTSPVTLRLEGRAIIAGRETVRAAVPADDLMQAFAYRHLVPAQELKVAVWGRDMARTRVQILTATPLRIAAGATARVELAMPISPLMGKVEFELNDAPDGIAIKEFSTGRDHAELVLQTDAAKLELGLKGNLIIQAFAENSPQSGREEPSLNRRRVPLGTLPAVPFEIVAK